jgi:hypothetical protein
LLFAISVILLQPLFQIINPASFVTLGFIEVLCSLIVGDLSPHALVLNLQPRMGRLKEPPHANPLFMLPNSHELILAVNVQTSKSNAGLVHVYPGGKTSKITV